MVTVVLACKYLLNETIKLLLYIIKRIPQSY